MGHSHLSVNYHNCRVPHSSQMSGIFARMREPLFLYVITESLFRPEQRLYCRGVEKPAFMQIFQHDLSKCIQIQVSPLRYAPVERTKLWWMRRRNSRSSLRYEMTNIGQHSNSISGYSYLDFAPDSYSLTTSAP